MTKIDPTDLAVGTKLPDLTIKPISRTTLALFAGASNDHNPIHIDIDAARSAGLDDVFAHGMLSMAYLGRLLTKWFRPENIRTFDARFVRITPVHGQPTCSAVVTSINEHGEERTASLDLTVTLVDGTVTMTGETLITMDSQAL